jgi:hypothetical protein
MRSKGNENETGLLEYIEEVVDTKKYISTLTTLDDQINHHETAKRSAYQLYSETARDFAELEPRAQELKSLL